ncbi:MAG: SH3 domain-containing protein [Chloroflexi bacterium]|nr:SH3 domain-containing protein [Chloroflexota bacterium]
MHKRLRWFLLLAVCIIPVLSACEEISTATPSSIPPENAVAGQPTRTVKPIVSFTPRFTATPEPSITPTPSITPPPTETGAPPTLTPVPPSLTPTPLPTASGVITAQSNVNLREGPGLGYQIAGFVRPGAELAVIGMQTDDSGFDWYKVEYEDENGELQRLWVRSNLVRTDYNPAQFSAAAPAPTEGNDSSATDPARTPGPTPAPDSINILAYCRQKSVIPRTPTTNDSVNVEWSWFVARPELMQDHLDNANYEVRLDGELLDNWETYATEMKQESGVWIVYWYYPVGQLDPGEHEIAFELTWDDAISDGYQQFGPGTAREVDSGNCVFNVTEAS